MIGREVGSLLTTVEKLKRIYGEPPSLAFNSENYLDWVNTRIPDGVLFEVNHAELEPFYLSTVRLVLDSMARIDDPRDTRDREDEETEGLNAYRCIEEVLDLRHVEPRDLD